MVDDKEKPALTMWRVGQKDKPDVYFEKIESGREYAQVTSIFCDDAVILEQVEVTAGKPLDEVVRGVLIEKKPLWSHIILMEVYRNGEMKDTEE